MIVVDASVLVTALADVGDHGQRARVRIDDERLAAPAVVDLEVASALRRLLAGQRVDDTRAAAALDALAALRIRRSPHGPLLARVWELRTNLTVYDAAYVALAEVLGVVLLTADGRLTRAPGLRCEVELLA